MATKQQTVRSATGYKAAALKWCHLQQQSTASQSSNLILFDIYYFVLLRFAFSNWGYLQPTWYKTVSRPSMTEQLGLRAGVWLPSLSQQRLKHAEFKIFLSLPLSELMRFSWNSLCCWCFVSKVKSYVHAKPLSGVLWHHLCTRKWRTYWLPACNK